MDSYLEILARQDKRATSFTDDPVRSAFVSCDEPEDEDFAGMRELVRKKIYSLPKRLCEHLNRTIASGAEICTGCGVVTNASISIDDKDTRYSGLAEARNSKDPTRCHKRKSNERSIQKDVEGMQFPQSIIEEADKRYRRIIGDEIYRGSKRRSIIVACIYYTHYDQGEFIELKNLEKKFGINKKNSKEGLSKYAQAFPDAATTYITPKDLIYPLTLKLGIQYSHLKKIYRLCDYLEDTSRLLNRSNPQSVAAAILYLYICLEPDLKNKLGMTKIKFANIVGLSDITIMKLAKKAQRIIQNDEVKL